MEEKTLTQARLKTPADYEAAIEQCLSEMARLQQQMRNDQAEIDQLKTETRALLAKMKAA